MKYIVTDINLIIWKKIKKNFLKKLNQISFGYLTPMFFVLELNNFLIVEILQDEILKLFLK